MDGWLFGLRVWCRMSEVQELVTRKGFSVDQLNSCIDSYAKINVWSQNPSRTKLTLI